MTAYWWVCQNQTWKHERSGGYLWAPFEDPNGHDKFHWENMEKIEIGDIIFSYANGKIKAISIANGEFYISNIPEEFGKTPPWKDIGRKVEVEYQDLENPLPLQSFVDDVMDFLPEKYSPIASNRKKGNVGYLYSLTSEAAAILLQKTGHQDLILKNPSERSFSKLSKDQITTRKNLIDARIGQGKFREELEEKWKSCAITEVNSGKLLTASHIKPWSKSDNKERLDRENGILLVSTIDKAFDSGLITFSDSGDIIFSKFANKEDMGRAGINQSMKLRMVTYGMKPYLGYHREEIFQG
tara:strand:- start:712 stop:1605 length:894 start_codon:yes stop_codon:yes gene_type:complete